MTIIITSIVKKKPSSTINLYKLVIEFTMQKLVNIIAIASGVVSLTVIGIGGYVYVQRDAILESVKEKALGSIGGGALGGALKGFGGGLDPSGLAPGDQAPSTSPLPQPSPGLPVPSAPIGL